MPYRIVYKKKDKRPYKIQEHKQGRWVQVGSSVSEDNAYASIRARRISESIKK